MAAPRLLHPADVRMRLARTYTNQKRQWLTGSGTWPLDISLGAPREADAQHHRDAVSAWVSAWQAWQGSGELAWQERRWQTLGVQRLPVRLSLAHAEEIAAWVDESARWQRAVERFEVLTGRWPELVEALPRQFEVLADYSEADFGRLEALLAWLVSAPSSDLYLRQLPVHSMDSKWLEKRKGVVHPLISVLKGQQDHAADFYQVCGLKPVPKLVRLRLLDPALRTLARGLSDISAPLDDLARLDLPVQRVFIVENVQTGLAFGDVPGAVVLMGLGYGVDALRRLPWLTSARCVYWGDIDTHGFAILNRARQYLPQLASVLMDAATLLDNRDLWTEELQQHAATHLSLLTVEEHDVFGGLRQQRWGTNVRLEQERIDWSTAWSRIIGT